MTETIKVHAPPQAHCEDCNLAPLCLPLSLTVEDMDSLDEIVKRSRPLKKGESLFRQSGPFGLVFIVRSGALRISGVTDAGEEQIAGFHLPSELVDLFGMDTGTYPVPAQALETASVCETPFERLGKLSEQLSQLRRQLVCLVSWEIRDDQQMMLLPSKKTADERIATPLVSLSAHFHVRGFPAQQFRLVMSRNEIGSCLGLVAETVSRAFTCFQQNGPVSVEGKEVRILGSIELCTLAGNRLGGWSACRPPTGPPRCRLVVRWVPKNVQPKIFHDFR